MMMNITETLGLKLPIFQAPLSCYPNQEKLVAAVSQNGALGILCGNYQDISQLEDKINAIQSQTANAFAVMIDVSIGEDKVDLADRSQANRYLADAYKKLQVKATEQPSLPHVDDLLDMVIENRPPVIIFQNGLPSDDIIQRCQSAGIMTMAIAGNTLEAIAAAHLVDAIILQGSESAGVQSRFPNHLNTPSYPASTLLHHALINVDKPLIIWGDVQFPQNVVAHLINGASAVMLDSLFWTAEESPIPSKYRHALITQHNEMQTTISRVWLGHPAQTLKNKLTQATEELIPTLSPKTQQRIMIPIIQAAIAQDNPDYMPMWAGLCAVTTEKSVTKICAKFLDELNEIIT